MAVIKTVVQAQADDPIYQNPTVTVVPIKHSQKKSKQSKQPLKKETQNAKEE